MAQAQRKAVTKAAPQVAAAVVSSTAIPPAYVPAAPVQGGIVPNPVQAGLAQAAHLAATITGTHPSVAAPNCQIPRQGTARSVAHQVLLQLAGQPLPVVLGALKVAETQWHLNTSRTVKSVAPAGWLRTLGCTVA
jgi:hypothetical protein